MKSEVDGEEKALKISRQSPFFSNGAEAKKKQIERRKKCLRVNSIS